MRAMSVRLGAVAAVAAAGGMGGCFVPASGGGRNTAFAPEAAAEVRWPEAESEGLRRLAERTPDAVPVLEVASDEADPERLAEARAIADASVIRVLENRVTPRGLFRVYDWPARRRGSEGGDLYVGLFGLAPNASFLTPWWWADWGEAKLMEEAAESPQDRLRARTLPEGLRPASEDPDLLLLEEGISVELPGEAPGARGILVRFTGLLSTGYEERMVAALAARGWAVVHVETSTGVEGENAPARRLAERERIRRARELVEEAYPPPRTPGPGPGEVDAQQLREYTDRLLADNRSYAKRTAAYHAEMLERAKAEIPLPPSGLEWSPGTDAGVVGSNIAAAVDRQIAAHAYAAEAAVRYLDERRPDLAGKPVAVIGFSAGALVAPAAAARLGDRCSALVLIGGGGGLLRIGLESEINRGGSEFVAEGVPRPRGADLDALERAYLERVQLDPLKVAPVLAGMPALHVHAAWDRWVPASSARRLNKALRPQRLVHPGGHGTLFHFMHRRAGWIARWLERHAAEEG